MAGKRIAAFGALMGLGALALAPVLPAQAAGLRTFPDAAGDAGTGFDITSVGVSNTAAGKITFTVSLPALAAQSPDMVLLVPIDTVGSSDPDYSIGVYNGVATLTKFLPGDQTKTYIPQSLTSLFTPGLQTISINRSDLGGVGSFDFLVVTVVRLPSGDIDNANTDSAPDASIGHYQLALPTKLLVRSSALSPGRPSSGGTFAARAFVRDVTLGAPGVPAKGGTVTCRFRVGGRAVTAKGSVNAAGRASCTGAVPKDAAGRVLSGTLRYRQGAATITRTFTAVVR